MNRNKPGRVNLLEASKIKREGEESVAKQQKAEQEEIRRQEEGKSTREDYKKYILERVATNNWQPQEHFDPIQILPLQDENQFYQSLEVNSYLKRDENQARFELLYDLLSNEDKQKYADKHDNYLKEISELGLEKRKVSLEDNQDLSTALYQAYTQEYAKRITLLENISAEGQPFEIIEGIVFIKNQPNIVLSDYSDNYIAITKVLSSTSLRESRGPQKRLNRYYKIECGNNILPALVSTASKQDIVEEQTDTMVNSNGEFKRSDEDSSYFTYTTTQELDREQYARVQMRNKAEMTARKHEMKSNGETFFETQEELKGIYGEVLAYKEGRGWVCRSRDNTPDLRDSSTTLVWKDENGKIKSSTVDAYDTSKSWDSFNQFGKELVEKINE